MIYKKIIFGIVMVLLVNMLPLSKKPELFLHPKFLTIVFFSLIITTTQPMFSIKDIQNNSKDRLPFFLIALSTIISCIVSEIEWAYYRNGEQEIPFVTFIGLLFMLAGAVIRVWSIRTLGKYFSSVITIEDNHVLIETGPYQYVRHPSYSGAFLILVGCPVFLGSLYSIPIAVLLMSLAYAIRINREEKILKQFFGEKYIAYCKTRKKMFPFIW